jgi:hypothetical protein
VRVSTTTTIASHAHRCSGAANGAGRTKNGILRTAVCSSAVSGLRTQPPPSAPSVSRCCGSWRAEGEQRRASKKKHAARESGPLHAHTHAYQHTLVVGCGPSTRLLARHSEKKAVAAAAAQDACVGVALGPTPESGQQVKARETKTKNQEPTPCAGWREPPPPSSPGAGGARADPLLDKHDCRLSCVAQVFFVRPTESQANQPGPCGASSGGYGACWRSP